MASAGYAINLPFVGNTLVDLRGSEWIGQGQLQESDIIKLRITVNVSRIVIYRTGKQSYLPPIRACRTRTADDLVHAAIDHT